MFRNICVSKRVKNTNGLKHNGLRVKTCQNVFKRVYKCQNACQQQFLDPSEVLKVV